MQKAGQTIDAVPNQHPFEIKYHKMDRIDWESCSKVLDNLERKRHLLKSWWTGYGSAGKNIMLG